MQADDRTYFNLCDQMFIDNLTDKLVVFKQEPGEEDTNYLISLFNLINSEVIVIKQAWEIFEDLINKDIGKYNIAIN